MLQYARGFSRLGHDVMVVEPVDAPTPEVVSYFLELGLPRAALLVRSTRETVGLGFEELASFDAEVLINVSGILREPELTSAVPVRVYLDLDPVFIQLWHAQGVDVGLAGHTHYLTVGSDLARTGITLDRRWIPTLPPVVLEDWRPRRTLEHDAFTTVGNWRSYGSIQWRGKTFGQKAHAVRRLLELPGLTDERLAPALAIDAGEREDLNALRAHRWELIDPAVVAGTPSLYRDFVAGSKGELGLAKAGYVDTRCGWFSDRSACYLASGRPVVAHDTGFGRFLPAGEGLVAFGNAVEAAAGIARVCADYERHSSAARAIAECHLDSDIVLGRLLESVL